MKERCENLVPSSPLVPARKKQNENFTYLFIITSQTNCGTRDRGD